MRWLTILAGLVLGVTPPAAHTAGMAVHDVGSYRNGPLKPGHVFSIDPQLRVTDFLPMELDDMGRLVLEKGVVQKVPPVEKVR